MDHRELQGPQFEILALRDVILRSGGGSSSSVRGAFRFAWGFDPTGDGDELFAGVTVSALQRGLTGEDRVRMTVDGRYRVCVGVDELKTALDVGIWVSLADRIAVGPLIGVGLMYDFTRNYGLLASVNLGAAAGESRVISFGGGLAFNYRFE